MMTTLLLLFLPQVHTLMADAGLQKPVISVSGGPSSGSDAAPNTPPQKAAGERDLSDQLLETWMLLEYCDQGNLEAAARDARFKRDFVSLCKEPSCY